MTFNQQTQSNYGPLSIRTRYKKTETHPEGAIFARGACDDKGQMYMHVKAFGTWFKTTIYLVT
jgi:acetylornithine deacetylase/succinyl-diaminopimelate desuccinylase-like protein